MIKKLNENLEDSIKLETYELDIKNDLGIYGHKITKDQECEVIEYVLKNKGWICNTILKWYGIDGHDNYPTQKYVESISDTIRNCYYRLDESLLIDIPANFTLFDALCEFSLYDTFRSFNIDTAPGDGIVLTCAEYIEKNYPKLVKKYLGVTCKKPVYESYLIKLIKKHLK